MINKKTNETIIKTNKVTSEGDVKSVEKAFNALGLKRPPMAIAFADENTGDELKKIIPDNEDTVPAGCSFWEKATKELFYTKADDHAHCTIGMYTHNLIRGEEDKARLMEDIGLMKKIDYVRMEEVPSIPALKESSPYVVYGPWKSFQSQEVKKILTPAVVMLFSDAERGLILSEAVSRVDAGFAPALGRPACAVIPQVINTGKAAVSFGCCGARAYVMSLGRESDLWVLPEEKLSDYASAISVFAEANQFLSSGHNRRQKDFRENKTTDLAHALPN